MALALLSYDALLTLALAFAPGIWSEAGAVIVNGGVSLLSTGVALEAARRAKLEIKIPGEAVVLILCAGVSALLIIGNISGEGMRHFRPLCLVYFCAVVTLGTVARSGLITDRLDLACLWGLFLTRWLQLIRAALFEIGPWWSKWAGGCAAVAWMAWCFMVYWHSFTAAAESRRR